MLESQRYRCRAPNVIHETFDDEVIIVDLDSGTYFSVDQVGSDIWTLLHEDRSVAEIVAALAARYQGAEADIARDVSAFLHELLQRNLVVAGPGGAARPPAAADPADARRPWSAPRLEPYEDMQDLLLLDPIHEVDEAGWPRAPRDAG